MLIPDYELPPGAIAQTPTEPRDAAKLLVALGETTEHRTVADLPSFLRPGDVVVLNSSKVLPARLHLNKATGGAAEVLLLEPQADGRSWEALVRPGRRLSPGTVLLAGERPVLEIGERTSTGGRIVTFYDEDPSALESLGTVALPPYIVESLKDPGRYQTVYADKPGSVAAPTAGLHLTREVLSRCERAGAKVVSLDLCVGLGTFRPVTAEKAEDHVMHSERYMVSEQTWQACKDADRVIAVGTTALRALETVASGGGLGGRTGIYIRPGFSFGIVDVLLTNFHQPRSTLLLLLEAFAGSRWRDLYAEALSNSYRFLSFGDAMLVDRVLSQSGQNERRNQTESSQI